MLIDRSSDGAAAATGGRQLRAGEAGPWPALAPRWWSRHTEPGQTLFAGDLLRINFNFSFPHLECQYASVDVSDVLGMVRVVVGRMRARVRPTAEPCRCPLLPTAQAKFNLTKTVRKRPIDAAGSILGSWYVDHSSEVKHEAHDSPALLAAAKDAGAATDGGGSGGEVPGAVEVDKDGLAASEGKYPLLLVNYYAPWCPWSQRLGPVWEAAAKALHGKYPPGSDGRLLLAKVDCTRAVDVCRDAQVQGFPSVRVYRSGSDLVDNPAALGRPGGQGMQEHATYVGDRTVDAIVAFAEGMLPAARTAAQQLALPAGDAEASAQARFMARGAHPGCAIDGFVAVKKVPGALYVSAQSASHSFVAGAMNVSHSVHELTLGSRPTPRRLQELSRLMPGGLPAAWADKLAGQSFGSPSENVTHEHYLQIVRTLVKPLRGGDGGIDAYEYTAHSHAYTTDGAAGLPRAKFSFAPSPMLVQIVEYRRYGAYHFITTVSALIGGVFTVASIADAGAHTVARMMKKQGMGKLY